MMQTISAYGNGIDALINKKKYNGCMLISSGYPFFSKKDLESYCKTYIEKKRLDLYAEFALDYFNDFFFFIGDYLLHYNLMAFEGMDKETALTKSKIIGTFSREKTIEVLENISKDINVYVWEDFKQDSEFKAILQYCKDFSYENERFKQKCLDLTRGGTKNKLGFLKENYGKNRFKNAMRIAGEYAIEDVAATLFFYKHSLITISKYELYPVLKEISSNNYPYLNKKIGLEERIGHIQIVPDNCEIYRMLYDDENENLTKT